MASILVEPLEELGHKGGVGLRALGRALLQLLLQWRRQ